jgi:hypothetical protein
MADTTLDQMAGQSVTLDEMSQGLDVNELVPAEAVNSSRNKATQTAMLTDEPEAALAQFNTIVAESQAGNSDTSNAILDKHKQGMKDEKQQVAYDMMATDLSEETKASLVQTAFGPEVDEPLDSRQVLVEQALIAPSEGASVYDDAVREENAELLVSYEDAARGANAAVNREMVSMYQGEWRGAELAFDMFSLYFFPVMENAQVHAVTQAFTGGESSWLMGNAQKILADSFRRMNPEQRLAAQQALVDVVNSEEGAPWLTQFLGLDNDYAKLQVLREDIMNGEISDFEVTVNNVASVVEGAFFVPMIAKAGFRAFTKLLKFGHASLSAGSTVAKVNPAKSREIFKTVDADETGDVAKAVYGTDKTSAIADAKLPDPLSDNPIPHKTPEIDRLPRDPSPEAEFAARNPGRIDFTDSERLVAEHELGLDFSLKDVTAGMRAESSSVGRADDGGYNIKAVYSGAEGGYLTPQDALNKTANALRKYGVGEDEMTVLKNTGDGYTPVDNLDMAAKGDYKVQVDYKHDMGNMWAKDGTPLDAKYWIPGFKSLAGWKPELVRHFLDPASMFKGGRGLKGSAESAVDRSAEVEKILLLKTKKFSDGFHRQNKGTQGRMMDFLRQANAEKLDDTWETLRAHGFSDGEAKVLKDWKAIWDDMWHMENADAIKTLEGRGFKVLENTTDKIYARPVASPKGVPVNVKAYDPEMGVVRAVTPDEVDALYETGGQIAKTATTHKVGDDAVDYMISTNTDKSFLRAIRPGRDTVMGYTPWHYTVRYKDDYFVRAKRVDSEGNEYWQALATARNKEDAEAILDDLAKQAGKTKEEFGRTTLSKESLDSFDDAMSLAHIGGRTTQRMRGERLADGTSMNTSVLDDAHIENPVMATVHSARSVANRVTMRDWLEGMKGRWMTKYGDMSQETQFGEKLWPSSVDNIGDALMTPAQKAEAKSTWEYIKYMERGYSATMDTGKRVLLNAMADFLGTKAITATGASKAALRVGERASLLAAKPSIVGFNKNLAFQAYLGTNPVRQFVVQSHQASQLLADNPWQATKAIAMQAPILMMVDILGAGGRAVNWNKLAKVGGFGSGKELKAALDAYEKSGLKASIDHSNLVEGGVNQMMADTAFQRGTAKVGGAVLSAPRQLGFDAGENFNLLTAFVHFRNKAIKNFKNGKGFDPLSEEGISLIAQEARNYTYSMNRAGDLPYNRNSFATFLQFMQVPHKAILNMTLNRQLTVGQKARLAGMNIAMFGAPTVWLQDQISKAGTLADVPEEFHDIVYDGAEQVFINSMMTSLFEGETELDLSSLDPVDPHGWLKFMENVISEGGAGLWDNSPSGKLWSGRILPGIRNAIAWGGAGRDGLSDRQVMGRIESLTSISSGFNSAWKLYHYNKYGRLYNSKGAQIDLKNPLTAPEQIGMLMGLSPEELAADFALSQATRDFDNEMKENARAFVDLMKQRARLSGEDFHKGAAIDEVISTAWDYFDEHDGSRDYIMFLIKSENKDGGEALFRKLMQAGGIKDTATVKKNLRNSSIPDEAKPEVLRLIEDIEGRRAEEDEE